MVRSLFGAAVVMVVAAAAVSAQAPQAPAVPATPAPAATPATPAARSFTAPVGLLFNTVRPERVADFERVVGYLQAALERSADATVREQAKGWRVFKASEPGPGGTVLYVFVVDPTVPGADYGLGRILADVYTDTAQLQEIWKLYTGAVTGGGSLLNLTPVRPASAAPAAPGAAPPPPSAPAERPLPPDADPNRR